MERRRTTTSVSAIALAAALACLPACHFQVPGVPFESEGDLGVAEYSDGADLAKPAFSPAHVAPSHVQEGAASLTGIRDIDTDDLLLDGHAPPAGVVFQPEATHDSWAVLSVRDFNVTGELKIHGRRAFILVAVGDVKIDALIHAEAQHRSPGPGGHFTGPGRGGDGKNNGTADSGGGGAGHGVVGAAGGPSNAPFNAEGGAGGIVYTDELAGGSGGGDGAGTDTIPLRNCPMNEGWSRGGAGGGVVQISAKGSLDLGELGAIDAGGGGGRGGCKEAASAGGGGGSGGSIWLEAPTMRLLGKLAANGGGGGSGGHNSGFDSLDGQDGQNGRLALVAATGGASSGDGSGEGGAGGSIMTDARPGLKDINGGGGGGAVGRIRLRTRAVSPMTGATTVISPTPDKSVDFN